MQAASVPTKFPIPWGNSAGAPYIRAIPVPSQQGVQTGAASLTDGFPPATANPSSNVGPFIQDMNGILNEVTIAVQWDQAGGRYAYDTSFASSISGYPAGAVVQSSIESTDSWINLQDGNQSNPDAAGAGWAPFGAATGDIKWRPTAENLIPAGWVKANATSIGSAASGASQLASARCQLLYLWLWNNFSQAQAMVSGGRGVSALTDFNANKPIQVLDLRGVAMVGMDTMGGAVTALLANAPVVSGAASVAGSVVGESAHVNTVAETAPHNHVATVNEGAGHAHGGIPTFPEAIGGGASAAVGGSGGTTALATTGLTVSTANTGGGAAHNNVQLSMVGTIYLKL